jgi:hypothetical protein
LLEVAGALQQTGLVVQDGRNQPTLDGFSTTCRILQYFFSLVEVDGRLGVSLIVDADAGLPIEFLQFSVEFL